MHKNGTQHIIHNEIDEKTQRYKVFSAEEEARDLAKTFQNSYQIQIFACCRDLSKPDDKTDDKPDDKLKEKPD